jgi:hypothetical protein
MFRPLFVLVVALICTEHAAHAQVLPSNAVVLSYALDAPFVPSTIDSIPALAPIVSSNRKSPMLAAALSFVVPGLGEYYVGDSYWRGAIFTALEAGLWIERLHWYARGDDSTAAFWSFSDQYWDENRYVHYLDSILVGHGYAAIDANGGRSAINAAEDTLNNLSIFGTDPTVKNFTHHLPPHGTQQYYELISKYWQFTQGWDDAVDQNPGNSPHDMRAAIMREDLNHQYEVGDFFLYGVILNHVLSAIDASLVAHDHNATVRLQGSLERVPYIDGALGYVPTAHLQYRF